MSDERLPKYVIYQPKKHYSGSCEILQLRPGSDRYHHYSTAPDLTTAREIVAALTEFAS